MNVEKEILEIKNQLANLQRAFLSSQKNNVTVIGNADKIITIEPEVGSLREDVSVNTSNIFDSQMGLAQSYELGVNNSNELMMVELAVAEIYEILGEN